MQALDDSIDDVKVVSNDQQKAPSLVSSITRLGSLTVSSLSGGSHRRPGSHTGHVDQEAGRVTGDEVAGQHMTAESSRRQLLDA